MGKKTAALTREDGMEKTRETIVSGHIASHMPLDDMDVEQLSAGVGRLVQVLGMWMRPRTDCPLHQMPNAAGAMLTKPQIHYLSVNPVGIDRGYNVVRF